MRDTIIIAEALLAKLLYKNEDDIYISEKEIAEFLRGTKRFTVHTVQSADDEYRTVGYRITLDEV